MDLPSEVLYRTPVGDVRSARGEHCGAAGAELVGERLQRLVVEVGEREPRAARGGHAGGCRADAACGAGDQAALAVQVGADPAHSVSASAGS